MDHIIVFSTLGLVLLLFIWGRIRYDFVALIGLFILVIAGIISPDEAFTGFGHPAVVTVAAVLVIGKSLEFSGLIDVIGTRVLKLGKNLYIQLLVLCVLVAFASAFMNNVGALALIMPVAIHLSRKTKNPPSYLLMPIAFCSLLGGMTTLIGTPPNIIIATFRGDETGVPFSMFSFTSVGSILTVAGIIFIVLIGWKLLPHRKARNSDSDLFEIDDYITEVKISKDSEIIGKTIKELREVCKSDVQILGLVRNGKHIHAPDKSEKLEPKDIIILETETEELKIFLKETDTKLVGGKKFRSDVDGVDKIIFSEAVVMTDSPLIGNTAASLRMRSRYGINLLAIARREQNIRRRIDHVYFQSGDVLLLQGREHVLHETITGIGCLPLAKRKIRLGYKTKIPLALVIFATSIVLVVSGLPVQIAFPMAAVGMVLSGILPLKEVYTSINWPVIILLGAMIPVGAALETSGGAQRIASGILTISKTMPTWSVLALLMVSTMLLSDVVNNAATVVLMAPIAIGVAKGLGLSIDPFLMTVAIGGSSAFLTPIGHQSNTLVMGPGGYRFTDYWRMGLPMDIIIVLIGIPMIMAVWPV
jgi:di/tricarboxylate transporter